MVLLVSLVMTKFTLPRMSTIHTVTLKANTLFLTKTDDSAPITIVAKFSDDKAAETSGVAQAASSSAGPAQASVSNFEGAAGQNKLSYGVGMAAVVAGLVM